MRRFILTHHQLPGQIELIFDQRQCIALVDFRTTDLNSIQTDFFLKECPRFINTIEAFVKKNNFTCVEADFEVTFKMFWEKYGHKVDKKRAEAVWDKLSKTKQVQAYFGIDKYRKYLSRTHWAVQMEAKSYLKNERWEDQWK